ncbi:S-layer homology domain-containing protein [Anaerovorax sp. IOR16]|uniref:S-layer homology domain-containing protein n=1 Tax=Anaerovorax sp. IOR16 TaxID=2773458 RepID=UPI0019D0F8EE|nr:S-layer homology domain-containing protein [Anaerovorax sp. IOR16]
MKKTKFLAWILTVAMLLSIFGGLGTISYADYKDGTGVSQQELIEAGMYSNYKGDIPSGEYIGEYVGEDKGLGYITISFEDYGIRESQDVDFPEPLQVLIPETRVYVSDEDMRISHATVALLNHLGIEYENTGKIDDGFYLACINNFTTIAGKFVESFGEFCSGSGSGWMITHNDWFINMSTSAFKVESGDYVRWQNTCSLGKDIGCSWDNQTAALKDIFVDGGTLSPGFETDTYEYELQLNEGVHSIKLRGMRVNSWAILKYLDRNDKEYKVMQEIPVSDGDEIRLKCSFAEYAGNPPTDEKTYTLKIVDKNIDPGTQDPILDHIAVTKAPDKTSYNVGETFDSTGMEVTAYYSDNTSKVVTGWSVDKSILSKDDVAVTVTYEGKNTEQSIQVHQGSGLASLLIFTGGYSDMEASAVLGAANESYPNRVVFSPTNYQYSLPAMLDTTRQLRFTPLAEQDEATIKVVYDGGEKVLKSNTAYEGTNWANCLKAGKNQFSLVVTSKDTQNNTTYIFAVDSYPTLKGLSLKNGSKELYLDKNFNAATAEYNISVANSIKTIQVNAEKQSDSYTVTYNGGESSDVNIDGKDSIDIAVTYSEGEAALTKHYTVKLNWVESYNINFNVTPQDAIVCLYDSVGEGIERNNDGSFSNLLEGDTYTYTITKNGYVGQTGTLTKAGDIEVTLSNAPAPANPLPPYSGDWVNFRGNDANMGVTEAKTPITANEAVLKWSKKYGSGWSAAPTPPIVLNNDLYMAAGKKVYRLDKETGEQLAVSEEMVNNVGFAMNPITYAEGMLFVPVGYGRIQALRADTLESLWVSEKIGGQTLCPTAYNNGYIYGGTWNKEDKIGNYFCLSVTDEDPSKTDETKLCTWKINHKGGFYWAGAYATDNYVIFGSDDGSSEGSYIENAVLYSCDPLTGEVLDTITGIKGDIRSTVSYDKETDRIYFSTKGGWFYTVKVNNDGTFDESTIKYLDLGGMCTGTPLVYNGLAYLGVSGPAQFSDKGHSYKIIDVTTNPMTVVGTADIPGYVQTSALLSTAYAKDTNKVYVYATYNYKPGGIYVIEVEKTEQLDENGAAIVNTKGGHLFVPKGDLEQYCICSLVCDNDGTLYYKNDSCYLMAIKNSSTGIPPTEKTLTGITISKAPDKVTYKEGETFNVAGMEVTAQYNDKTTEVVTGWTVDKSVLAKGDTKVIVTYKDKTAEQAITVTKKNSGGGSSSGGGSTVTTSNTNKAEINKNADGKPTATTTTKTEAETNKDGKATATVSEKDITTSLNKSLEAAKKEGKNTFSEVRVEVKAGSKAKAVEASLPVKSVKEVANAEKAQLTLATPMADLTFDQKALESIGKDAQGSEVKVSVEVVDSKANAILKELTELTRPVYDLKMVSNGKQITNFKGGEIFVSLPYTLEKNEKAANVCVYYIDDNGKKTQMKDCTYDSRKKRVQFRTNHFSYYAIGYKEEVATGTQFRDVRNKEWYAESIMTLVNKGILKGKTATTFEPNSNITRAEFTQILYGMAKASDSTINTDASSISGKFKDVKSTDWYANAVAWASEQGVVAGATNADGSMNFAPNAKITRQDMAVMILNYQNKVAKKELTASNQEINFADASAIAGYAKEAVTSMQKAGIISGIKQADSTYKFAPKSNATRAEAATMIAKLIKN